MVDRKSDMYVQDKKFCFWNFSFNCNIKNNLVDFFYKIGSTFVEEVH
jgi:hypothetical protein